MDTLSHLGLSVYDPSDVGWPRMGSVGQSEKARTCTKISALTVGDVHRSAWGLVQKPQHFTL